jgi:hypothetical protein
MKILNVVLVLAGLMMSGQAIAGAQSVEVAIMQSESFAEIIAERVIEAKKSDLSLKIGEISTMQIDEQMIVNIELKDKPKGIPDHFWGNAGSLVAFVKRDSAGRIVVEALYFKPASDLPGGASVGNF